MSFAEFAQQAAGYPPYPYQERLAREGLPEVLTVPTGSGKTLAATLPWLYRRRVHPDRNVRSATPRRLAFVLPMRVLVEQTSWAMQDWLTRLCLADEVGLHVMMGGEGRIESQWRMHPERDAIFVGTLDMLLSRALNRGYGESRFAWPIDFGLFNSDVQWVFDEVQLMGPALPTSRQLEGLRRALGAAIPCASTWMSATIPASLGTVDLPNISTRLELSAEDRIGPLQARLDATKLVRHVPVGDPKQYAHDLSTALLEAHRPGTLSIAVLNTVARAREVRALLATSAEVVLLHSRFRPGDREAKVRAALAPVDPGGPGRIIVATQVLEAGVDISATTLLTEAAPWPSVVQRAGRCNRDGKDEHATMLWSRPPVPQPYDDVDIDATCAELESLEGQRMTSALLGSRAVAVREVIHPVLRRRDLLDLFDTAPDLTGHDVDIGRFLRSAEDLDVHVAWRNLPDGAPEATEQAPTRTELCPVPLGRDLRRFLGKRSAWRFDHVDERWVSADATLLRPGQVVLLRAQDGGYDADAGWDPSSTGTVVPMEPEDPSPLVACEEATGADPLSTASSWVSLLDHLRATEAALRDLAGSLGPAPGLLPEHVQAAAAAARLHDLGKVHPVFQESCLRTAVTAGERAAAEAAAPPWAKSGGSGIFAHSVRHFRHELVSALALLGAASVALRETTEADLVTYLVAAHHGRIRLGIRSLPDENPPGQELTVALGLRQGDQLPPVEVPGVHLPACTLDLGPMAIGGSNGGRSWTQMSLTLRDRPDLGPFRLAFLEALVRLADWRASATS